MDAIELLELLKGKIFSDHDVWNGLTKKDFNSAIREIENIYSQLEYNEEEDEGQTCASN